MASMETKEETMQHFSISVIVSHSERECMVNMWNNLDKHVMSVSYVNCFKNMDESTLVNFDQSILVDEPVPSGLSTSGKTPIRLLCGPVVTD